MPPTAAGPIADRVRPRRLGGHGRPSAYDVPLLVGAGALVVGLAVLLVDGMHHGFSGSYFTDTWKLVRGARVAIDCVKDGTWTRCGLIQPDVTNVRYFPLLQYIPAAILVGSGVSYSGATHQLAHLSGLAFVVMLVTLGLTARRRVGRGWGLLLVVTMTSGLLLFYATAEVGEMLAACWVVLFVAAVLWRRSALAGIALFIACLGKETFAPFLLLLGLVCARDRDDDWLPSGRVVVPMVAGAIGGVVVNGLFNVFRFGTPLNKTYLRPYETVYGVARPLRFSTAIWWSPNAGVAWFWPMILFVLSLPAVALLVVWRRGGRGALGSRQVLPTAALYLDVIAFTGSIGRWWAPFGWASWGSRLIVPLLPGFALAAIWTAHELVPDIGRVVFRSWLVTGAVIAIAVVALLPQVGAVWDFSTPYSQVFRADNTCPQGVNAPRTSTDMSLAHRCLEDVAWRVDAWVLPVATHPGKPGAVVTQVALGISTVALTVAVRSELVGDDDTRRRRRDQRLLESAQARGEGPDISPAVPERLGRYR